MRRLVIAITLFLTMGLMAPSAHADWRWKAPNWHRGELKPWCSSKKCLYEEKVRKNRKLRHRLYRFNKKRLKEWKYWTSRWIPTCTWFGESGQGPQFARYRYYVPNSGGSGAFGKYQMMPGTYSSRAKYGDWSPLDQEIAGHLEFYAHGTGPWANC